jgi:glycosyltransferase involved in cell wall biosynthesis
MNTPAICFDARMASFSGIGTYIRGLLNALSKNHQDALPLTLITSPEDANTHWDASWKTVPVSSGIYSVAEQVVIPNVFRKSGAALLHVPHYNLPILQANRCVITVHDLIHLKFPEFLPSKAAYLYAWAFFHLIVPKARGLLTVSENTKKDLMQMLRIPADRITVTYPGVPEDCKPQQPSESQPVLDSFGLKPGYFLYVGNLKEFKNVQRLLQAYQQLQQSQSDAPPLVFVGHNFIPGFDQALRSARSVVWIPEINRSHLPKVYAGALALIFPSLYEGFGLPPLEAMACGIPVICSNRGSLPEVVGDAAVMIDPLSLDEMARAMNHILNEPSFRQGLAEKGLRRAAKFNWDQTARQTRQVYEQCLK